MKNQYAGDINDYLKYSVLRALGEAHTTSLLVCWMLTSDDGGTDGRKISYLRHPDRYRRVDPELFDGLGGLVSGGERSTAAIESLGVLPGATFFAHQLEDAELARREFLTALWREANGHRVVFFDPDNGLSVGSVKPGKAGSRRYVFCSDLAPLGELGAAAIVYQHFPRVSRAPYVDDQLSRLAMALPGFWTAAIYSSHLAFLVAAPRDQIEGFRNGLRLALDRWAGCMDLTVAERGTARSR